MKTCCMLSFVAALIAAGGPARAHGPQIQITGETGTIVTHRMLHGGPYDVASPETRLFVIPVVQLSGRWFAKPPQTVAAGQTSGPGYAYPAIADPHPFQDAPLTLTFTEGLLRWNGMEFVDAGATQFEAYRGSGDAFVSATTSDPPNPSALTWDITPSTGDHSSVNYKFLGDGASDISPLTEGIYLLPLAVSQSGLNDSAPFYFLLPHGVSRGKVLVAQSALAASANLPASAVQFVPEPSTALGGLLCVIALGVFRCRHQRKA